MQWEGGLIDSSVGGGKGKGKQNKVTTYY